MVLDLFCPLFSTFPDHLRNYFFEYAVVSTLRTWWLGDPSTLIDETGLIYWDIKGNLCYQDLNFPSIEAKVAPTLLVFWCQTKPWLFNHSSIWNLASLPWLCLLSLKCSFVKVVYYMVPRMGYFKLVYDFTWLYYFILI